MGHTATLVEKRVYMFGGSKGEEWLTDLHILDTVKWNWYAPIQHGTPPKPRVYHQAVTLDASRIVYFGGNGENQAFNDLFVLTVTAVKRSETQTEKITWSSPQIHNPSKCAMQER